MTTLKMNLNTTINKIINKIEKFESNKIQLSAENSGAFIAARSIYYSICSWATHFAI